MCDSYVPSILQVGYVNIVFYHEQIKNKGSPFSSATPSDIGHLFYLIARENSKHNCQAERKSGTISGSRLNQSSDTLKFEEKGTFCCCL